MNENDYSEDIIKMKNTINVLVKEFNKMKEEILKLSKENDTLSAELDRLYRYEKQAYGIYDE